MQYTLKNFPHWFKSLGEVVNDSATRDEAVRRLKIYLHQEPPETVLSIIHNTKHFYRCHRQHLGRWIPAFTLNHGCSDILVRAAVNTYSEMGLDTRNFRNGNTFQEDVDSSMNTHQILSLSYRNELLLAFGKSCLVFGSRFYDHARALRKAEGMIPDVDLIYLPPTTEVEELGLSPEAAAALSEARVAVEEHMKMFEELRPQRYMANIKMTLLDWLLGEQRGEFVGISREDFITRVTMFVGQLDAYSSVLNDRTDMVKAIANRGRNARTIQGFIRSNCTQAATFTPGVRDELTSIFTLGFNALNVKQRFPKLRQSLLDQHLSPV